jgi:hypothetical protein
MADTTVIVAIVTGTFAIIGATIPQVTTVLQSRRQAESAERQAKDVVREHHLAEKRDACTALRRAVGELRNQVASNYDYHGDEMTERLARVREFAEAAQIQAVYIAMLLPEPIAGLAMRLGAAASRLAVKTAEHTDINAGVVNFAPDFTELDPCTAAFVREAVNSDQY